MSAAADFAPGVRPSDRLQQARQLGVLDALAKHRLAQLVERAGQQRLRARALLDQAPAPLARVQLAAQVDVDVPDRLAQPADARAAVSRAGVRNRQALLPARQARARHAAAATVARPVVDAGPGVASTVRE